MNRQTLLDRLLTIEAISAINALGWGIWMALFNVFEAHTYDAMADLAPQPVWAAWFIGIGTVVMGMLLLNRTRMMPAALPLLAATWAFVAVMFVTSNVESIGIPSAVIRFAFTAGVMLRRNGHSF